MEQKNIYQILILEDVENDVELLKRSVKKFLPNVVFNVATNKAEFAEKLSWQTPDFILSDYHLPGYNGLDAMFLIRKKHPHIPFIFVTGTLHDEEKVAQAILGGASGYVLKNNLQNLQPVIEKVLEAERALFAATEKERKKIMRANLRLQKIVAKVKDLDIDNSIRDNILTLLEELKADIAIASEDVSPDLVDA